MDTLQTEEQMPQSTRARLIAKIAAGRTRLLRNESTRQLVPLAGLAAIMLLVPVLLFATKQDTNQLASAAGFAPADVNRDGRVNLNDASFLRVAIANKQSPTQADLNRDGVVNEADLELFYVLLSQ